LIFSNNFFDAMIFKQMSHIDRACAVCHEDFNLPDSACGAMLAFELLVAQMMTILSSLTAMEHGDFVRKTYAASRTLMDVIQNFKCIFGRVF